MQSFPSFEPVKPTATNVRGFPDPYGGSEKTKADYDPFLLPSGTNSGMNLGSANTEYTEHAAFFKKIRLAFECVSWSEDERTAIIKILRRGQNIHSPDDFLLHFRDAFRTLSTDEKRPSHNLIFLLLSVLFCGSNERALPSAAVATIGPNERRYRNIMNILNSTTLPQVDPTVTNQISACNGLKGVIKRKLENEGLYAPTTNGFTDSRMFSVGAVNQPSSMGLDVQTVVANGLFSVAPDNQMYSVGSDGEFGTPFPEKGMSSVAPDHRMYSVGSDGEFGTPFPEKGMSSVAPDDRMYSVGLDASTDPGNGSSSVASRNLLGEAFGDMASRFQTVTSQHSNPVQSVNPNPITNVGLDASTDPGNGSSSVASHNLLGEAFGDMASRFQTVTSQHSNAVQNVNPNPITNGPQTAPNVNPNSKTNRFKWRDAATR
jgi:hypothetical protein